MNIMSIIPHSECNGPGDRMVIWTQGCTKGCYQCFNPESWTHRMRLDMQPARVAMEIQHHNPAGLTLSGGDPLEQPDDLYVMLATLHGITAIQAATCEDDFLMSPELPGLPGGIILFTGYVREQIFDTDLAPEPLADVQLRSARMSWNLCDLVIDGRFENHLKYQNALAGSTNQRFWWNPTPGRGRDRIPESGIFTDQQVEIHESDDDALVVTGFPEWDAARMRGLGLRVINS